jgi:hypothetical protein
VPCRPPFVWSQRKSRPFALIGRSGYQQKSPWDLVQLRAQLGLWRKCLTLVDGYIWHHIAWNARQDPPVSGIRRALLPDSDLERQLALPENSAGRKRLVRLSHNIVGRDINITSFQSGPGAYPLSVVLETAWTTMLQSYLNVLGAHSWCDRRATLLLYNLLL